MGASADITVAVSDLAVQMLNSTSSGLSFVSTMAWSVTASSAGAVEASWNGIDLHNVSCARAQGKLIAENPAVVQAWLASSAAKRMIGCQSVEALEVWSQVLGSLAPGVPAITGSKDFLDVRGSMTRVAWAAQWGTTDEAFFHYEFFNASFSPQWSNPLWSLLDFPLEGEAGQVTRLLDELLQKIPASPLVEFRIGSSSVPEVAADLWRLRRVQARRAVMVVARYGFLVLKDVLSCLVQGDGMKKVLSLFAAGGVYWLHCRGIFKGWQCRLGLWFQHRFSLQGDG